jgi:hypothetical protein
LVWRWEPKIERCPIVITIAIVIAVPLLLNGHSWAG